MRSIEHTGKRRPRMARPAIAGLLALALTLPVVEAKARERDKIRDRDVAIKPQASTQPIDRGPLLLVVSLRKQKLRVFDLGGEIASTRVSTGMPGFDTPTGVFSVLEKKPKHYSNIYAGAPMPFMQRLTWSGIALHAGVVPGYRASHGCIRLPASFAKSLFGLTRPGVRVVVAQDESQPQSFAHSKLFRPLPERAASQVASAAPDTRVAANDAGAGAASLSEFSTILGVTPALAAAVADRPLESERPRTRADADRRAAEQGAKADAMVKTSMAARLTTLETAKASVGAAEAINGRLLAARRTAEPERRAVRTAEADLAKAHRAFEAYMRAPIALASTTAEDKEGDLEDAILDGSIALAEARAGIARGELELATLEAEAGAANRARAAAVAAVRQVETDLKNAQLKLAESTKDAARRVKPLSVLISVKTGRIYIRQGFEAVLEAPIELDGPPRKIGTYVLTAMRYDPRNPDAFDWRMVTAQPPSFSNRSDDRRKRRSADQDLLPAQGSAGAVLSAALDGLRIPDEILATISERARPGASIIVTDRELKENENGLNTEFVLHTR